MKILVAGTKWHDNLLEVASFGFSELDHQTEVFDDNLKNSNLLISKILNRSPFRNIAEKYYHRYCEFTSKKLLLAVEGFKPDLVFVINGIKYLPSVILKIRQIYQIPVVAYVVDDPVFSRTWIYDLSTYSHLFVIDKSWMEYLKFFNKNIFYLPSVADHQVFHPLNIKRDYDIAFGGALSLRMPNAPSGFLRAQILDFLAKQRFRIKAFGPGIKETFKYYPALKKIDYYDGYKSIQELNKLYNSAKIVLTIHSPQFKTGISPRVFEVAFSKSFQLVEYKSDIKKLFPEGIISFKSNEELFKLVNFYLKNELEREKLALAAYKIALQNHTFKSRAEKIIEAIKEYE